MDQAVLLQFASYMFHDRKLSIPTITTHLAAIADPLKFAFNISVNSRFLDLLKSSFFLQRPPAKKSAPSWSLRKVLLLLASDVYSENASQEQIFRKAVFLVALASGFRISELAALTRSKSLTRFAPDFSFVMLATNPKFLFKNERLQHRMKPSKVPALRSEEGTHALCPVAALHSYISAVPAEKSDRLWIWPTSRKSCSSTQIASVICSVIKEADPEAAPTAHDVRGYASSVAFARSLDPFLVQEAGQWASCATFINRYLDVQVEEVACVALGSINI